MRFDIDLHKEVEDPEIAGLNLSAFGQQDLVNLILQRSEILFDQPAPNRPIRAWNNGDSGPINDAVERMGELIARRAAAIIRAEFRQLKEVMAGLAPKRIADIGCGYAIFDLFAARELGSDLLLIDIESNERRHFGFEQEAAAYTSLDVARQFLRDNGVQAKAIQTLNPNDEDVLAAGPVDLAVSFLSCGFHYPVDTYMPFFGKITGEGGAVILDLRARAAAGQIKTLSAIGTVTDLPAQSKVHRVLVRKPG